MNYTKLKKQEPMSYGITSLPDTLVVNNPINSDYLNDYLCENPWTVKGIEAEPETKIDWGGLSEIINKAVREAIKEDNLLVTPKIEKSYKAQIKITFNKHLIDNTLWESLKTF